VTWTLRYASHLGYGVPGRALFHASAGSPDPAAQVEFAAALGLAGVQFAKAVERPKDERVRVRRALERHGLETGCIIYAARETAAAPLWGSRAHEAQRTREQALLHALDVAAELNARHVVVLSGVDATIPPALQHAALIENLKRAAELAARREMVVCLESVSRTVRPTLLPHIADAYAVVRAVDSPHVRLIFDTAHVQAMDGDLLENLRATWDAVAIVQIADNPGRLQPGTGELNFQRILDTVAQRRYSGLVELEYNWSHPTRACEQAGIDDLRALDAALAPPEDA
jgi:hydroxypyruvate isomerase